MQKSFEKEDNDIYTPVRETGFEHYTRRRESIFRRLAKRSRNSLTRDYCRRLSEYYHRLNRS